MRSSRCVEHRRDASAWRSRAQSRLKLLRVQANSKAGEVDFPADPNNPRRQSTLVPGERNPQKEKQDDDVRSPNGCGCRVEKTEQVVDVNLGRMTDTDQPVD